MCWISHWIFQRREKLFYFSHTFILCWTNPIYKKCRRRISALKTENKVRSKHTHTLRFFWSHVCNKKDQICCTGEALHTDMDIHIFKKKKIGIIGITNRLDKFVLHKTCQSIPSKQQIFHGLWIVFCDFLNPSRHNLFVELDLIGAIRSSNW